MTHFNKGPSYGLSAEVKNKVRPGSGGVPTTGRRRAAPPPARLGCWRCGAEASGLRGVAARPYPVPGWRRRPWALSWLCSRAGGRTSGGRGVPSSWNRAARALGHGSRSWLQDAAFRAGGTPARPLLLGGAGPNGWGPREQRRPGLLPTQRPLPSRSPGRMQPQAKLGGYVANEGAPIVPCLFPGPVSSTPGTLHSFPDLGALGRIAVSVGNRDKARQHRFGVISAGD